MKHDAAVYYVSQYLTADGC